MSTKRGREPADDGPADVPKKQRRLELESEVRAILGLVDGAIGP